jgi:hypothetical protein
MTFLLLAIPLLAFALAAGSARAAPGEEDLDKYEIMYRLAPDEPDKYTPGQRQFDPGFLVLAMGANDVLINAEDAISEVSGRDVSGMLIKHMLTRHSEGDWGDLETQYPESAAAQDEMIAKGDLDFQAIRGIHNITGVEVWIQTNFSPDGNVTTFMLPGED